MSNTKWQKGVSGNPKGKPKGVKNKDTEFVEQLRDFIARKTATLDELYDKLPPKEQARLYADILPYTVAKKKEVEHTH